MLFDESYQLYDRKGEGERRMRRKEPSLRTARLPACLPACLPDGGGEAGAAAVGGGEGGWMEKRAISGGGKAAGRVRSRTIMERASGERE